MSPKRNPLKLNKLQLKTLTLMQALAELPAHASPGETPGTTRVGNLPAAHGNHFHLGDYVVAGKDATGLANAGAWKALERKGLATNLQFPHALELTEAARTYDTGLAEFILHRADH